MLAHLLVEHLAGHAEVLALADEGVQLLPALQHALYGAVQHHLRLVQVRLDLRKLVGLVRVLHDETELGPVRVSALRPGPMRSALRGRAYVEEAASKVPWPADYAGACVELLSAAGAAWRGQVFQPEARPSA